MLRSTIFTLASVAGLAPAPIDAQEEGAEIRITLEPDSWFPGRGDITRHVLENSRPGAIICRVMIASFPEWSFASCEEAWVA